MKTFLLLVGLGLALATPFESDFSLEVEYPREDHISEVITEFEDEDYSKMSIEELINEAATHPGLEFLNDAEAAESMGINPMNIHPDLIYDAFATTDRMIRRRGYPTEVHHVWTRDGYRLEMHRIPGSPLSPPSEGKPVAYLQHGLLDSSATWVIMGPESGLGYILADLGYDVWLGNVRGNRYSRKHDTHDPDGRRGNRRRFWNFSWHEMGTIDLPTMIDYITSQTGQRRMHYVGHSQGTTSFFVMCAQRPEFNDRIISSHMLAPIAFMGRLRSPFVRAAAMFLNTLELATGALGMYEFLPSSDLMALLGQAACRDEAWFQSMCSNVLFLIGGFNSAQMNGTMLPVILGHTPAGASTDQVIHYGQGIRSNRFRQFDHGSISNLFTYGSFSPPRYNLANIRAPTTLYYSLNDWLSEPRDVRELFDGMPAQNRRMIQIEDSRFNHFDYVWAIDVKTLVYDKVVEIMKQHE